MAGTVSMMLSRSTSVGAISSASIVSFPCPFSSRGRCRLAWVTRTRSTHATSNRVSSRTIAPGSNTSAHSCTSSDGPPLRRNASRTHESASAHDHPQGRKCANEQAGGDKHGASLHSGRGSNGKRCETRKVSHRLLVVCRPARRQIVSKSSRVILLELWTYHDHGLLESVCGNALSCFRTSFIR